MKNQGPHGDKARRTLVAGGASVVGAELALGLNEELGQVGEPRPVGNMARAVVADDPTNLTLHLGYWVVLPVLAVGHAHNETPCPGHLLQSRQVHPRHMVERGSGDEALQAQLGKLHELCHGVGLAHGTSIDRPDIPDNFAGQYFQDDF